MVSRTIFRTSTCMSVGLMGALASCSSRAVTESAPETRSVVVELHAPPFGGRSGNQCEIGPRDVEDGPFSLGAEIRLEDEAGVILGRTKVGQGELVSDLDCKVLFVFEVSSTETEPRMFVLVNNLRRGWKLMPSEVVPGPAVLDIFENPAEDV